MDFSKVRLADFAQARLREAGTPHASIEEKSTNNVQKGSTVSYVCTHTPRYTVTHTPLVSEATAHPDRLRNTQIDPQSQYIIATTYEGIFIWEKGADSVLFFPLQEGHDVTALLVPATAGVQPGLLTIDRKSGSIMYWASVNRAVGSTAGSPLGAESAHLSLGKRERIEFIELVPSIGFVAATNEGHFYLVNLWDDLGKRVVQISPMRAGSGIVAMLRSIGAFSRDISAVKCGRLIHQSYMREIYFINRYGDITLWHVGLGGISELVREIRVGEQLCTQMNMLYPNCEASLIVHDLTVEQGFNHILASFAPRAESKTRYMVILTMTSTFEVISVRRLQSYESVDGDVSKAGLHVQEGVLVIVCKDAIAFLDSVSQTEDAAARWEETVALKATAALLGSLTTPEDRVHVATTMGILQFEFCPTREQISTTKIRLLQAIFEASPTNPLDLTKWPAFEAQPDANAPYELAVEIANSQTSYVPAQLPNLGDHISLRAQKLHALFNQAGLLEVREVAQAVAAAGALYFCYESTDNVGKEVRSVINSVLQGTRFHELVVTKTTELPDILGMVAAKPLTQGIAHLVLAVLKECSNNGMGIPDWASKGSLRQALESLTSQAADTQDSILLAQTTDMLCALYEGDGTSADNSTIKNLLHELSKGDGMSEVAMEIANKYNVFSALAPLEVAIWQADNDSSMGFEKVCDHITEFGEPYANAVFDTCILSGYTSALIKQLAQRHRELVTDYLKVHKLYKLAWTLDPGTASSTSELALAMKESKTLEDRRLYASLYKLSAYTTKAGDFSEAQIFLDLVAAQEMLKHQHFTNDSTSAIVKHGISQLDKLLDRETAVDLLALVPPQAVPESNDNFVVGFRLVDAQDIVRQRLLIQQLVCNTNWDRVSSTSKHDQPKKLKQTLFYHTLRKLPPGYAAQLRHFRSSLIASDVVDIKRSYRWDVGGLVTAELESIAQRAVSIADKYAIDEFIESLTAGEEEAQMDVDN